MDGISVILLVHNEIKTISKEIDTWTKILAEIPNSELVIAEDASTDGTKEFLLSQKDKKIVLCQSESKRGYRKAFIDAVDSTQYDYIFLSDTGGKNDINDFWGFYYRRKDFDLITGLKVQRQDQLYRILMTKVLNFIVRKIFNIRIFDGDSGFRIYNKKILKNLIQQEPKFTSFINLELTLKFNLNKYNCLELPIRYFKREGSSRSLPMSKLPRKIYVLVKELIRFRKINHFTN